MAKSDGPQAETSLAQAGLPPSYGMGIQQGMYGGGNSRNFMQGGNGFLPGIDQAIARMTVNGMGSSGPSQNMLMQLFQHLGQFNNGMNNFQRRMDNGMGGPAGTGFNFGTPISSPNLFSGLSGVNGGGPGNQTTPYGASRGFSTRQNTNNPQ